MSGIHDSRLERRLLTKAFPMQLAAVCIRPSDRFSTNEARSLCRPTKNLPPRNTAGCIALPKQVMRSTTNCVPPRAAGCTRSVAPMPLLRMATAATCDRSCTRKCAQLTLKLDKNSILRLKGEHCSMNIDVLIPYFVLLAGRDDRQKVIL